MLKKILNLYIKHKTKNYTRIPIVVITFNWQKYKKYGKKDSCLANFNPKFANDEVLKQKFYDMIDYIRDNYDMEQFTKF